MAVVRYDLLEFAGAIKSYASLILAQDWNESDTQEFVTAIKHYADRTITIARAATDYFDKEIVPMLSDSPTGEGE